MRTIITIYTEEKNLFHKLRSSINEFKSVIIEPRNKIENNNFIPTYFLLPCRDEITLCVFIAAYEIPSVIGQKPSLQSGELTMTFFLILMCLQGQLTVVKHGLCH